MFRKKHSSPKKKRSLFGVIVKSILAIIALLVLYVVITFSQVYFSARNDGVDANTNADAIVVLGAAQYNGRPSAVLSARLDHALKLYEDGVAPVIIVTGGNQPGDNVTEATASANYLIDRGVDDSNILREVQGNSTYTSLRDTAAFAKEKDIVKVVLVTDGFHILRSKLIAKEVGLKPIGSPIKNSPISGNQELKHFVTETGRVSLGRIVGFRRVSKDSSILRLVD